MTARAYWAAMLLGAALVAAVQRDAFALGDTYIQGASCSVATGGNANNNTVTCNFGLTPEQLKQVTEAAVTGATGPLLDRIVAISKRLGVTEDAAKSLLRIVGKDPDVPIERLAEALTSIANDYKRLQVETAALNPENSTARELVAQARAEIQAGNLQQAHELLRQASYVQIAAAQEARKLRERAQAAEDAEMLGAARLTAVEGDVSLTERHYAEAAELFGQAAGYVPPGHPGEHTRYLERQADALFLHGDERGDNAALRRSIQTWHLVLQERAPRRMPMIRQNLANALARLGERESGTARLEEAVAVFRVALDECRRDRVPLQWAMIQNNLGSALLALGERESGTVRLEEAITAYRAALEEQTRDRVPLQWAMTQMNLGYAFFRLGERESGTVRLEEAVAAYRAAVEVQTRHRGPVEWAMIQHNLGNALARLGEREDGTARLEEAIRAYHAALEERPRERVPLQWAATQNTLGIALWMLGDRESGTVRLEEAVAAFHAALQERTRERVPLDWATTQMDLGVALSALGERESRTERLEEALTAFRAALEEYRRDRVPLQWAMAQHDIGNALVRLGEREAGTGRLEEAVAAYHAALEERTRDRVPLDWAATTGEEGIAIMLVAERLNDPTKARIAVQQVQAAFVVIQERENAPAATYFKEQLQKAQDLLDRLTRRSSDPDRR